MPLFSTTGTPPPPPPPSTIDLLYVIGEIQEKHYDSHSLLQNTDLTVNVSIISNEMVVNCKPALHHYILESGNEMFKKLHSNLLILQLFLHPKIKENDPASEADNIFDRRN